MVDRRVILTRNEFEQLPEYSASLPTWGEHENGSLLGTAEWKRRTTDGWLMGKAKAIRGSVFIDWYIIDVLEESEQ